MIKTFLKGLYIFGFSALCLFSSIISFMSCTQYNIFVNIILMINGLFCAFMFFIFIFGIGVLEEEYEIK
jgi:hypothetical protein